MQLLSAQLGASPGKGSVFVPYAIEAANFDGTNDYLNIAGALDSVANGKLGIFSGWFTPDAAIDGNTIFPFRGSNIRITLRHQPDNSYEFEVKDTGGSARVRMTSATTYLASAGRLHILLSWDCATSGNQRFYVNDSNDKVTNVDTNNTLDYSSAAWGIGAQPDGTFKWDGCIGDFYLHLGAYLDFDVEANRRKFISGSLTPVDLGSDGSTPTASQPDVFFSGDVDTWHINKGFGGGFTENGVLTSCSS